MRRASINQCKATAPAGRRPVVLPPAVERRVKCSLRSNTEPKQPNSGRSSPTHRVRRRKRGNSAISSRPTQRLPKTKNGWQSISIRRPNGERITTTVLPLLSGNSIPAHKHGRAQTLQNLLFAGAQHHIPASEAAPSPTAAARSSCSRLVGTAAPRRSCSPMASGGRLVRIQGRRAVRPPYRR
jgi:hypothetical protein